jgi:NADPH-dependent curcumin reductase CurA
MHHETLRSQTLKAGEQQLDPACGSHAVGVLGMLGLTAHAGMVLQCEPKSGDTAVVSAASGGVGQIAGQIARLRAVAWWASPGARRSAAMWWRSSASTPVSRACHPVLLRT